MEHLREWAQLASQVVTKIPFQRLLEAITRFFLENRRNSAREY